MSLFKTICRQDDGSFKIDFEKLGSQADVYKLLQSKDFFDDLILLRKETSVSPFSVKLDTHMFGVVTVDQNTTPFDIAMKALENTADHLARNNKNLKTELREDGEKLLYPLIYNAAHATPAFLELATQSRMGDRSGAQVGK